MLGSDDAKRSKVTMLARASAFFETGAQCRLQRRSANSVHGVDVSHWNLIDISGVGDGFFKARLPQQVQDRVWRTVGEILGVIGIGFRELIVRVEAGDLKFTIQLQVLEQFVGIVEKLVVLKKLVEDVWVNK